MHRIRPYRVSRSNAIAAVLVAAVQFGVVAFGPLVEALEGASAPAHVEESGTRLHYSHNPDNCAACAAATMVGDTPRAPGDVVPAAARHRSRPAPVRFASRRRAFTPKSPRAPPGVLAPAR